MVVSALWGLICYTCGMPILREKVLEQFRLPDIRFISPDAKKQVSLLLPICGRIRCAGLRWRVFGERISSHFKSDSFYFVGKEQPSSVTLFPQSVNVLRIRRADTISAEEPNPNLV